MRTTLDIPDDVLDEARRVTRFASKTDLVTHALRELVRQSQLHELVAAAGTFDRSELAPVQRGKRGGADASRPARSPARRPRRGRASPGA